MPRTNTAKHANVFILVATARALLALYERDLAATVMAMHAIIARGAALQMGHSS